MERCKYLVSPQTVASQCFLLNKEFQDGCWAVWGKSDLLLHAGGFTPPSLHPGRSPTRSFTSQQLSSQWALLTSLTLSEAVRFARQKPQIYIRPTLPDGVHGEIPASVTPTVPSSPPTHSHREPARPRSCWQGCPQASEPHMHFVLGMWPLFPRLELEAVRGTTPLPCHEDGGATQPF